MKIYDEATGLITQSNIRTYEYNLATSNVKDAIVDSNGNTWVGVYWKGVLVMPDMATSFEYVGRRSVQKNTIGTNCVTSVIGDGHGDLWVATDPLRGVPFGSRRQQQCPFQTGCGEDDAFHGDEHAGGFGRDVVAGLFVVGGGEDGQAYRRVRQPRCVGEGRK